MPQFLHQAYTPLQGHPKHIVLPNRETLWVPDFHSFHFTEAQRKLADSVCSHLMMQPQIQNVCTGSNSGLRLPPDPALEIAVRKVIICTQQTWKNIKYSKMKQLHAASSSSLWP
jgi:hypothetical protein